MCTRPARQHWPQLKIYSGLAPTCLTCGFLPEPPIGGTPGGYGHAAPKSDAAFRVGSRPENTVPC